MAKMSDMNPLLAAGLGVGGGTLLGYLLTPKTQPHPVVYIAGSPADAEEIFTILSAFNLKPAVDFSLQILRGKNVPPVWLVAVPAEHIDEAKRVIDKYKHTIKTPPAPLPALPAEPPSDPREI